jgi:hypothetical protein
VKNGNSVLRAFAVGALAFGVAAAGVVIPAQGNPFAAPEASAACSSFKRAKVVKKTPNLTPLTYGELRNNTDLKQTIVVERAVSDTRTTAMEFRGSWELFKPVFTAQVSKSVTTESTISGMAQTRAEVKPFRRVSVTGSARTWYVQSEVTERNSKCDYKTYTVQGTVATTDGVVWDVNDIGAA